MTPEHDADLSEMTLTAIEAALFSGDLLARGYGTNFDVKSKKEFHNLVTEYDNESERQIIAFIRSKYPNHAFLAEETGGKDPTSDQYQWVIDPLDGTVNFAHSIPMFSVSIALRKAGKVLAGVVFHPLLHELFVAERGKGAFLNGKKIAVTGVSELKKSILAMGFPYYLEEKSEECIKPMNQVLKMGVPIRRIGVASLDLAYVACGRFDGFFEHSLGPWDCAAGNLLIEEAGGKVTTWQGEPLDICSYDPIMATNGLIHEELSKKLTSI